MHRLGIIGCVVAASVVFVAGERAAVADHPPGSGQSCDPYTGTCTVEVTQPGSSGSSGSPGSSAGSGGGGAAGCHWQDASFPCSDPVLGWFNNTDGCYYRVADPQPPPGDPVWEGHSPGDGAVYARVCEGLTASLAGSAVAPRGSSTVWLAQPPPGSPVVPPPAATLAQRALARMQLPILTAESNASASQVTYVGVPTWLWVDASRWHALSVTAAVGTRAVTLTATPTTTSWVMGDESEPIQCAGPGTPFAPADPQHPPCGYTYRVSSAGQPQTGPSPNDRFFTVQGSVDFRLHWICAGNCDQVAGDLPDVERATTPLPLRVLEVQTVVVNR